MVTFLAHPSAVIDLPCEIGVGTKIWHYTHVMSGAVIGPDCVLGQNVYVASTVVIGGNVKIQNNVSIYDGVTIEDYVFCGPSCVFTNVANPRSEVARKNGYLPTGIRRGATIGANATVVCGVEVGPYAFVGAGAVVTSSVPAYGLAVGVPARRIGWMSRHGNRLVLRGASGVWRDPENDWRYILEGDSMRCLDLPEDVSLPEAD